MSQARKAARREIFVLTPGEKRAVAGIVAAFLLGLATMQYRSKRPRAPRDPTVQEQKETKRAAARARSHRGSAKAMPLPTPEEPPGQPKE